MTLMKRVGYFMAGVGFTNIVAYKPMKQYFEKSQTQIQQDVNVKKLRAHL